MGCKKARHVVVEKCQAARAKALCIGRQVKLPTDKPCLQLGRSVTTIAEAFEDGSQVRHKEHIYAGICWDLLHETEIAGVPAKVTALQ